MKHFNQPSLALPRFAIELPAKPATKKKDASEAVLEFDIPDTAVEAETVEKSVRLHLTAFAAGERSVVVPASSGKGQWKWDLLNTLQVLQAEQHPDKPRLYLYQRVGYMAPPVVRQSK